MADLCDFTDLPKDMCAHCLGKHDVEVESGLIGVGNPEGRNPSARDTFQISPGARPIEARYAFGYCPVCREGIERGQEIIATGNVGRFVWAHLECVT